MLHKLFRSRPLQENRDSTVARDFSGDVVTEYEAQVRRGETPDPMLVNRVGDVYRDLGRIEAAVRKYLEAATLYTDREAWTPAMQMARKAERLMRERGVDNRTLRIEIALIELQVALGRAEWLEATHVIDSIAAMLLPSDGNSIERLVDLVDDEALAPPEVAVALGQALTMLARPEMALERFKRAHAHALHLGRTTMVAELERKIAQVEPIAKSPARRPRGILRPIESSFASSAPVGEVPFDEGSFIAQESPKTEEETATATDAVGPNKEAASTASVPAQVSSSSFAPIEHLPILSEPEADVAISPADELADGAPSQSAQPLFRPLPDDPFFLDEAGDDDHPELFATTADIGSGSHAGNFSSRGLDQNHAAGELTASGVRRPEASPPEGWVDLEKLRAQEPTQAFARLVGQDPRSTGSTEEEQVRDLVRQFRDGIRQVVPIDEADTHYDLGLSFLQMGMYDEAVEALQTAIRSPDHRRRAIEALLEALLGRGDALLAYRAARTAREELEEPGQEALGLLYWQARAAEALGRVQEASELYGEVCIRDVRFLDAHDRLRRLEVVGTSDGGPDRISIE